MHIDGQCHCGRVTYEAEIDPAKVLVCHCTDCQSLSGSAFRVSVPAEGDSFRLKSGKLKVYVKVAESGTRREQAFCPDCGTPIYASAVGGKPRVYGKRGDNGHMRFQHFCGDCGSPLFTSGEGTEADDWGIRWGSIRQRDALRPTRQIWCQSAAVWIDVVAGID